FFKTRPPPERGCGRALLIVRTFSWAVLLRKTIPGRRYCRLYQRVGALAPVAGIRHRLLLTIFERGLRGLGLYQWVSTAAFKKIEKAARPSKKSRRPRHFLRRPRL